MRHWHASCALGFCLTGRWRPLCSIIHAAPDCRARRAFQRWADRYFCQPDHTRQMHAVWLLGNTLRNHRP